MPPTKRRQLGEPKKRTLPTREEVRNGIEASMVALLRRTRTTLQHFKFCEALCEDIQTVLERHTEYVTGRPTQTHLKDQVRVQDPEFDEEAA